MTSEQAVLADLRENFECENCHNLDPKQMIIFSDDLPQPKGLRGQFCKPCARSLLTAHLLQGLPDVEAARRSFELGKLAQVHFRELQDWASNTARLIVDGTPMPDTRIPGFCVEEMPRCGGDCNF